MKTKPLLVLLLFAAHAAWAQTSRAPFEAIRLQRLGLVDRSLEETCVSVTASGEYRWERKFTELGGHPKTDVYEGKLVPADLKTLVSAIDNERFDAIQTEPRYAGLNYGAPDYMGVHVLRAGNWLHLEFFDKKFRRQYGENLRPVLTWWKEFEHQKHTKNPSAQPTSCRVPGTPDDGGTYPAANEQKLPAGSSGSFIAATLRRTSPTNNSLTTLDIRVNSDCVMVQGNGFFHREHQTVFHTGAVNTEIYEGTLSDADLKNLVAAVDRDDVRILRAEEPKAGLRRGELLEIRIVRTGGSQDFQLGGADVFSQYDRFFRPLFTWWKGLQNQKLAKSKTARLTDCRIDDAYLRNAIKPPDQQ